MSAFPVAPLIAAAHALARSADLDGALDPLLRLAIADRGAGVAVVAAVDAEQGRLHIVHGLGLHAAQRPALELSTSDFGDPLVTAVVERRPVEAADGQADPPGAIGAALGVARVLALPLVVGRGGVDQAIGVLALGWTADAAPSPGTPGVLEALADLVAVAVDRTRLASTMAERSEWFERLAHLDPLTGLANRRTFDRVLELELARAARQQGEISIAVFDVDAFRARNEAVGVSAGDDVLRSVAAVLSEQVRLVDTVARIGGDEFVVIAPGSGGPAVASRIIAAIAAVPPVAGEPVTVSAGVARFPDDGASADELLSAALAALATAREAGSGTIVEAQGTP